MNTLSTIYLIGGGEIHKGETAAIDADIKKSARPGSVFTFFPTAAYDSEGYIQRITEVYDNDFKIINPTVAQGAQFAIDAIKQASVIYLGGGVTKELMDRFSDLRLVEHLFDALDRGVVIVGISAGALALSEYYIHEEDDGTLELKKGWGIIPTCTIVHAKQNIFEKAVAEFRSALPANLPFNGIPECLALKYEGAKVSVVGVGEVWSV